MSDKTKLIEAALAWRNYWCDQKDLQEAEKGCNCGVCNLIGACDEYIAMRQNKDPGVKKNDTI